MGKEHKNSQKKISQGEKFLSEPFTMYILDSKHLGEKHKAFNKIIIIITKDGKNSSRDVSLQMLGCRCRSPWMSWKSQRLSRPIHRQDQLFSASKGLTFLCSRDEITLFQQADFPLVSSDLRSLKVEQKKYPALPLLWENIFRQLYKRNDFYVFNLNESCYIKAENSTLCVCQPFLSSFLKILMSRSQTQSFWLIA